MTTPVKASVREERGWSDPAARLDTRFHKRSHLERAEGRADGSEAERSSGGERSDDRRTVGGSAGHDPARGERAYGAGNAIKPDNRGQCGEIGGWRRTGTRVASAKRSEAVRVERWSGIGDPRRDAKRKRLGEISPKRKRGVEQRFGAEARGGEFGTPANRTGCVGRNRKAHESGAR